MGRIRDFFRKAEPVKPEEVRPGEEKSKVEAVVANVTPHVEAGVVDIVRTGVDVARAWDQLRTEVDGVAGAGALRAGVYDPKVNRFIEQGRGEDVAGIDIGVPVNSGWHDLGVGVDLSNYTIVNAVSGKVETSADLKPGWYSIATPSEVASSSLNPIMMLVREGGNGLQALAARLTSIPDYLGEGPFPINQLIYLSGNEDAGFVNKKIKLENNATLTVQWKYDKFPDRAHVIVNSRITIVMNEIKPATDLWIDGYKIDPAITQEIELATDCLHTMMVDGKSYQFIAMDRLGNKKGTFFLGDDVVVAVPTESKVASIQSVNREIEQVDALEQFGDLPDGNYSVGLVGLQVALTTGFDRTGKMIRKIQFTQLETGVFSQNKIYWCEDVVGLLQFMRGYIGESLQNKPDVQQGSADFSQQQQLIWQQQREQLIREFRDLTVSTEPVYQDNVAKQNDNPWPLINVGEQFGFTRYQGNERYLKLMRAIYRAGSGVRMEFDSRQQGSLANLGVLNSLTATLFLGIGESVFVSRDGGASYHIISGMDQLRFESGRGEGSVETVIAFMQDNNEVSVTKVIMESGAVPQVRLQDYNVAVTNLGDVEMRPYSTAILSDGEWQRAPRLTAAQLQIMRQLQSFEDGYYLAQNIEGQDYFMQIATSPMGIKQLQISEENGRSVPDWTRLYLQELLDNVQKIADLD